MNLSYRLLLLTLLLPALAVAQEELKTMIPPSPTTSALGEYGSVPVNFNSGVPDISVPLFEVKGKDIGLPINLSYHGGGIKVEEMSSWIGLGWSLNAGGVITRDTRGLPDESGYGYFTSPTTPYGAMSDNTALWNATLDMLDLEPDMFYFNFAGHSGSFVYDKVSDRFRTIPESSMKIEYLAGDQLWRLTFDDGTVYSFGKVESSRVSNTCHPEIPGNAVATGWYMSKIVNYNKTDSIQFEYAAPDVYNFYTLESHTKYFITEVQAQCSVFDSILLGETPTDCYLDTQITAQRLTRIVYRDGSVEFHKNDSSRCDLTGDYALDRMDVKDKDGTLLYSYDLYQSYFLNGASAPCASGADTNNFRLRLDSVNRVMGSSHELFRSFTYKTDFVPNRQSFGQDYWGYYNGVTNNSTLIPDQIFLTTDGLTTTPISYPGANRNISNNENDTQMGMLTRMTYPTGGYTEFTYENNRATGMVVPELVPRSVHLDNMVTPSGTDTYSVEFTIDYGPSVLNGFSGDGGALVTYFIDGIGCDYGQKSGAASTHCAEISVSGPTGFMLLGSQKNKYMPNGTYTLSIDYSNNFDSVLYVQDFYISASWNEIDTTQNHNSRVGGLRIKKEADYDPITGKIFHQKLYDYRQISDTTSSSASIDFYTIYSRKIPYLIVLQNPFISEVTDWYYCTRNTLSASSYHPIIGMGQKLSYGNVTVTDDQAGTLGKTVYEFTYALSIIDTDYPFSPTEDYSWRSGQLTSEKNYVKSGGDFVLARHVRKTFQNTNEGYVNGVKFGKNLICLINARNAYTPTVADYYFETYRVPFGFFYSDSTITRTYDLSTGLYEESYEMNHVNPDYYQVVYQEKPGSAGEKIATRLKYTNDYSTPTATDNVSKAIKFQKDNHINDLIEKTTWKKSGSDSTLIGSEINVYELRDGLLGKSKVMHLPIPSAFSPSGIQSNAFTYSSAYESVLDITRYDAIGNVVEGKGRDGILISYVWDAAGVHPIAQATGAAYDQVFYTGFEDDMSATSSTAYGGIKSHTGSYTVVLPGSGTRRLTYWKKISSGAWQYIETIISGNTTIGTETGALIDEVRVYPAGAQMTTYTYKPGVGVSSVTDPNNIISYYEYDTFSRLRLVRDKDGNIVKAFNYHYMSQQDSPSEQ